MCEHIVVHLLACVQTDMKRHLLLTRKNEILERIYTQLHHYNLYMYTAAMYITVVPLCFLNTHKYSST